jgi:hypothetical protein
VSRDCDELGAHVSIAGGLALAPGRGRDLGCVGQIAAVVLCTVLAGTAAAQINPSDFKHGELLKRIEQGNYVWSLDFLERDALLLGYGIDLVNAMRSLPCGYRALPDEEIFASGWISASIFKGEGVGPNFRAATHAAAASVLAGAQSDAKHLEQIRCNAPVTKRVMENGARRG